MDNDKKIIAGWWFWILALVLVTTAIFTALKPFGMWWDRQVMLESHQYKEARNSEQSAFESQIIAINMRLETETDPALREHLTRQRLMLEQQMMVSKRRQKQKSVLTEISEEFSK